MGGRCSFGKELYLWGWRWVVFVGWVLPYGLGGIYDFLQGQGFLLTTWPRLSQVIPSWLPPIWLVAGAIAIIVITFEGAYRIYRKATKNDISQIVEELLSVGIFTDMPVNITTVLYNDREKLENGLSDEVATNVEKLVLSQLNLRKIVQLEQRKVKVYGSYNVRDEGYWVLTELGKDVILYLQKNQQVLDREGSLSK
jgi:hypothetical protein